MRQDAIVHHHHHQQQQQQKKGNQIVSRFSIEQLEFKVKHKEKFVIELQTTRFCTKNGVVVILKIYAHILAVPCSTCRQRMRTDSTRIERKQQTSIEYYTKHQRLLHRRVESECCFVVEKSPHMFPFTRIRT